MMNILFMLPIWIFFQVHDSIAQDCSEVNLISSPNSPFSRIPVYNQEKTKICYAYAAAQMVDYQLIKNGASERSIHPAWLAMNYALSKKRTGIDIGHTKEAIEALIKNDNCQFKNVSDSLLGWAGQTDIAEENILALIEKKSSGPTDGIDPHFQKIVSKIQNSPLNPVELISHILAPACEKRIKMVLPLVNRYNLDQLPDDRDFEEFIQQRLARSPSPLSVAYCARVWKEPNYDGIEINLSGKRDKLKNDCEYHESLVVGKKLTQGSCHFLVRNTWGDRWKSSNRDWKCLCRDRQSGRYVDDCESFTHPDKSFSVEACWIPADKLSKNVGVITIIE